MAVDTPARIVILGAGPIGLEAALYARFLGYDVEVFERGEVAQHVRDWGHVRMLSPFGMNRSTLGLAALRAHDEHYRPPADDAILTGHEWLENYLQPLAKTDLLVDQIRTHTTVVAVGRAEYMKGEWLGDERREDAGFRTLVCDRNGVESQVWSEVVIDTTGVYRQPNWLGPGGTPALGESGLRTEIAYHLPDITGSARLRYAGRHTLVVGSGYSAATTVLHLVQLAEEVPNTRVTWVTRPQGGVERRGPLAAIPHDDLAERKRLVTETERLLREGHAALTHRWAMAVESIVRQAGVYEVQLAQGEGNSAEDAGVFDEVVANVGYRPDTSLYAELQIQECPLTQRPTPRSLATFQTAGREQTERESVAAAALRNPEPDFYVLGAKSYGRDSRFFVSEGFKQIQELFTLIGDRAELNLYENAKRLLD